MEGNASVYQVYPVSRVAGEGKVEVLRAWGNGSEQEGAGGGGKGGATQYMRGNYKSDKSDGFGRNAQVYHVYPVSRTTSEERAEHSRGWEGEGRGAKSIFYSYRSHR